MSEVVPSGDVELAVKAWSAASLLPGQFRNKDGTVKTADLRIACTILAELGLPPAPNLPEIYVIGGKAAMMAGVQRALAARGGYDLELVASDAERATVKIRRRRAPSDWHPYTVTMAQAKQAGWVERNPNYRSMPERMLIARACTAAIQLYAPEVTRGLPPLVWDTGEVGPGDDPGAGEGTETPSGPAYGPNGASIPVAEREPAIDDQVRAGLFSRLTALELGNPDAFVAVRDRWKELGGPNLHGRTVTRLHGWALGRLLDDLEPMPAAVHDDSPEATTPSPGRFDPNDAA